MLEINKRYIRTSPEVDELGTRDETIVVINNDQELEYHKDLMTKGFKYKELIPAVVPDAVCVSCE